jgi:outer membrane protein TolC
VETARQRALAQNPNWLAALQRLHAAEARVQQAEAGARPQVTARTAGYYTTQPPFVTIPPFSLAPVAQGRFPGATLDLGERFNARQELVIERILLGGPTRPNIDRARLALRSARFHTERARQELLYQVEDAYLQAAAATEYLRVGQENLRARKAHRDVALARFETGLAPRFDVVRADTGVAAAEEQVSRYQNDADLAAGRLALLVGDPLERAYTLSLPPVTPGDPSPLDTLIARATSQRPDMAAVDEERKATQAAMRAARSERKPVLGVRVEGRANEPNLTVDPSGLRVLLVGSWSIYDGGRSRGLEEEAGAQARALELDREQLARTLALEVRSAFLSLQNSRQRMKTAERQVEEATEAREIARTRYELGTGLAVEIADSEAALSEAQFSQVRAHLDYLLASAQLALALGSPPSGPPLSSPGAETQRAQSP